MSGADFARTSPIARRAGGAWPERAAVDTLVLRVAHHDEAAFARLYEAMSERVLSFVGRRLIDRAQTEEVVQEVFLEIWLRGAAFDPARGTAVSWILTMAARRAIDRIRASQSSRNRDLAAAARESETPFDLVVEQVQSREEVEVVHSALARISQLQREAITLTYLDGYRTAEIARMTGASETAVKARIRDGLIAMRRILHTELAS